MMQAFDAEEIAGIAKPIGPWGVELGCGGDFNVALE
jgi:hypothetical protein